MSAHWAGMSCTAGLERAGADRGGSRVAQGHAGGGRQRAHFSAAAVGPAEAAGAAEVKLAGVNS